MELFEINVIKVEDNYIYLATGEKYEFTHHYNIGQRHDHFGEPQDFCDRYMLKDTFDNIYIYKNKWSYYRPATSKYTSADIFKIIEKRKQKERIGNKYKHLQMTDMFSLKTIFPIYQDITEACDLAKKDFIKVFKMLKISRWKKYPLWRWIEGSKLADYHYNYLFTEYFEEEAN